VFGLYLTENINVATVAHEYSHLLCMRNVPMGDAEQAFFKARTKGLSLGKLKDITGNHRYGEAEVAYVDSGFLSPYTGREYGHGWAPKGATSSNEVTSMGATHIFEGEVERLYDTDPAHLFFTLSQYRGGK
jgi:hypothetical protein